MAKPIHTDHTTTCLNCGNCFRGHFCNTCSQDAHTGKIDRHFVYHEIQHALFHVDKGILYTLRTLFTAPGKTIKSFIDGKRVKHFKPLAFLIVMAGLYAFANHFFDHSIIITRDTGIRAADTTMEMMNDKLKEYFEWYVLIQLPLIAWVYFLFFRKYGTNYIEQLVICAYVTGMHTLISVVLLPLTGHYPVTGYWIQLLVPVLLFVWTYLQYYQSRSKSAVILKTILGYILFYLLVLVLLSILLTLLASI